MKDPEVWLRPMQMEFDDLTRLEVWELVTKPDKANVIGW